MAVFRVEKTKDFTIMCNHHLRNTELSLKAKGLLSLMLSLPEDWDYTTKGLAHICKDGVDSITTALKELERHGYLTRQRLRYGNGQLGDIEYTIHEKPVNAEKQEDSPKRENPRQVNPGQAKPEQAEPGQENPAQLNTNPLRTKKSKTDISRTHQSIYPAEPEAAGRPDRMDRIELTDAYREIIKENIEYDCMVSRYGKERLDETMELMLEVVLSKRPYIRIAGDDFPREVVKGRFLKINSGHLEYVFDCIDKNTTKVGNIKAHCPWPQGLQPAARIFLPCSWWGSAFQPPHFRVSYHSARAGPRTRCHIFRPPPLPGLLIPGRGGFCRERLDLAGIFFQGAGQGRLTYRKIAEKEGRNVKTIYESVQVARKKFLKNFE